MNRILLAVGTVGALVGVVIVVKPGVLALLSVSLPGLLVAVIGVLALLEGLRVGYSRLSRSVHEPAVPEPERRQVASVLGREFDTTLASVTGSGRVGGIRDRNKVRDRLTETAVEVLVRNGDTPEQARERLRTGSWTDDRAAAAFFAPIDEIQPTLTERVRILMSSDIAFRYRARRAIAALAAEGTDEQ